jgi:hypothetical protein
MFALVLAAALQSAAPFPGAVNIDGGWVPCSHPIAVSRGLGCSSSPAPVPVPAPVPTPAAGAPDCDPRPNPYLEPERAAACSAWDAEHQPAPPVPTYVVGAVYRDAYDVTRIRVLSVTTSLEGVPVVTGEVVKGAVGAVLAFRADAPAFWQQVQQ